MLSVHALGVQDSSDLPEQIRLLDRAELDGFFVTDHLFVSHGRERRQAEHGADPFVRLAVAGAHSTRMALGSCVVNVGLAHPALAIRSFLALAAAFGGGRILAGIGAGWNPEEFTALGLEFPPFQTRLQRLEEASALARSLLHSGYAELHGEQVVADQLPLGPLTKPPARLLLGGGSDRLLEIAGRYADVVDLNGSSRTLRLGGTHPVFRDIRRRLSTTVEDLEQSVAVVRASAADAGREQSALQFSVLIDTIVFCQSSEVPDREAEICRRAGLPVQSLADCPYVLLGPEESMRARLRERVERLGLRHVILAPQPIEVLTRFRHSVAAGLN